MISRRSALHAAALLTASCTAKSLRAEDWCSWRGAQRNGLHEGNDWPSDLSKLTKVWSRELSDSYSGPIVGNGLVFTTETIEKRDEALVALDLASGETVWRQQWAGAMAVPFFAKSNGDWIRSTPATDGKYVVVGGMRDVVACFEATTGKEVWKIDFVKQLGSTLPAFGLVCSPLIDGEFVYMQCGGAVHKLALADGKIVWSTLPESGGMSGGAFSSPMIATLHGVRQLVVQTRTTLAGVNPDDGTVLWNRDIASFRGMNILTPTVWNDQVFTSCYGGKAQLFALEPSSSTWQTTVSWEAKAEAYMSSPIVIGEHIYMHLKNNRFCCSSLATGEETWRTTPFGKYWSMITDGENILALDQNGELLLIEANPAEFKVLDRKQVSEEPSWAYLGMADNQLLVRRQHGLDAYRWE